MACPTIALWSGISSLLALYEHANCLNVSLKPVLQNKAKRVPSKPEQILTI